jgi:hypothetical protein
LPAQEEEKEAETPQTPADLGGGPPPQARLDPTVDTDQEAFESLRAWYSGQETLPDLGDDLGTFQEELGIAATWDELVRTKRRLGDTGNEAEDWARSTLCQNFRSLERANKQK